ncbi:MAG: hypothetical protein L0Y66_26120 [Myxococcaceae bacterium]|nr:hypothetical protein [Myxococcaceae bacterium]
MLLVTACTHSSRAERARGEALREALEAHTFPVSPEQARVRILSLGLRSESALPVSDEGCSNTGCSIRVGLGIPGRGEVRLRLTGMPQETTRVELVSTGTPLERATPAQVWRIQALLLQVWKALGEAGLADAQAQAARWAEAEAIDEWRTFRPRWGLTGAATYVMGSGQSGFAARFGVRRWLEPHLVASTMLESEWGTLSASPGSSAVSTHLLALPLRVELAPWTEFSAAHGLPDTSFSLFAGPTLMMPGALGPEAVPGLRAGVGLQLLHATDGVLMPLVVEAHVQQHALPGGGVRDVRFSVGVGF